MFITAALIGTLDALGAIWAQNQEGNLFLEARDRNGRSALHMACLSGNRDKIMYLLTVLGADREARTNGSQTPLMFAAMSGNI